MNALKIVAFVLVLIVVLGTVACGRVGRAATTQAVTSSSSSASSSMDRTLELTLLDSDVLAKRAVTCFEQNPTYWTEFRAGMFEESGMSEAAINEIQPADVAETLAEGMEQNPEFKSQMIQFMANNCE